MKIQEAYDKMNDQNKQLFWSNILELLKWRGWLEHNLYSPSELTNKIAKLFENNGCEIPEYT